MSNDDKDQSLLQLCQRHGTSVISQLVDIGRENNQQDHVKFRSFISRLQCLQPKGTQLHRKTINAFDERRYVALSYTWTRSKYEDKKTGRHAVEHWDDHSFGPSMVRECVLNRVLNYMRHVGVRFLWIDAHCIRQDTCGVDGCDRHRRCIEKRDAVQAMDLVYQRSAHPVALLGRPLKTESELHLLADILDGSLTDRESGQLLGATSALKARAALSLLWEITQDDWWWRAWTFQENYRGGRQMKLLIRHPLSLEPQKQRHGVFGELSGELCIPSVTFSKEATQLCLALRGVGPSLQRIDDVLRATGRYTLMLSGSHSMTPTVVSDIEARGIKMPWDRLAIIANCCQFPVRLDDGALSRQCHSLSLSVLAMCLLNGELLDNSNVGMTSVAGLTTSEFLNKLMFRAFNAPEEDPRRLTFNKGCRLTDVELTAGGIATRGHLWKLGHIIDTAKFQEELPWIDEPRGRLTLHQRRCLLQLVLHLYHLNYNWLAKRLDEYLAEDAHAGEDYSSFTDMYLHHMATELAVAVQARRRLRLGALRGKGPPYRATPYRAIFVWSDQSGDRRRPPPPAFVFTSVRPGDPGSQTYDANDVDCHVSLEVDVEEALDGDSIPQLRVQNWRLGMCFFAGCPRTRVEFPWPRVLRALGP